MNNYLWAWLIIFAIIILLHSNKRNEAVHPSISPAMTNNKPVSLENLPEGNVYDIHKDFVMGDPTAVSNAITKGEPDGWSIVCDRAGHYAPRSPMGQIFDIPKCDTVRTSLFEATVAAWRIQLLWDSGVSRNPRYTDEELERTMPNSGLDWEECDWK